MSSNFYLPAEWAPQSAVLLTWPHRNGDWGNRFTEVESNFANLASCISRYEKVIISFREQSSADAALHKLQSLNTDITAIITVIAPSNDVWARDHGPITVIQDGKPRLLDFTFNGWGGKYRSEADNLITQSLWQQGIFGQCAIQKIDCVLEGGAIETDGEGVLLTTSNCLPLPTRNPDLSPVELENLFKTHFGIHTVHWLNHGHLAGDDTDGHIDTIARFADAQTIVFQSCADTTDKHYAELRAMHDELKALRQPNGHPYTLHALPLPQPILDEDGQRLPASYANFLIINGAVLMPTYDDPADIEAAEVISRCFPERDVVSIDCRALIHQYGSLHCVTMQLPAQLVPAEA